MDDEKWIRFADNTAARYPVDKIHIKIEKDHPELIKYFNDKLKEMKDEIEENIRCSNTLERDLSNQIKLLTTKIDTLEQLIAN